MLLKHQRIRSKKKIQNKNILWRSQPSASVANDYFQQFLSKKDEIFQMQAMLFYLVILAKREKKKKCFLAN